jgi:hypothetical protein
LGNKEQLVDLRGCGHIPALVLEDKRMSHVMAFLAGGMVGGLIGVFIMYAMMQAKLADEREERWFENGELGHRDSR